MKELEPHDILKTPDKVELAVKKKQEIEYVLEGTLRPDGGHKIWEVNEKTGEVKEAEYKKNTIEFNGLVEKKNEDLIIKANCVYIPSLNAKNAKRRYGKNPNQAHYYLKPAPMKIEEIFNPEIF